MPVPKLRFKNDLSQDYPEWKVSKLGELFNVSAGGDIDGNNVRAIKTQDFCYPVYANALKNKGLYGYSNTYKIDGESFTITGRGDVGVAVSRHCNYTPIVRLLVCKPLHNENVDFFAECFNKTKVYIESTGVPQLTAPQVKNIKITYPSLSEQQKIADFLTTVDRQINIQSQRVEAMKNRKKGLLQKIFSQEIRFKNEQGREYPEWLRATFGNLFLALRKNALSRDTLNYEHGNIKNIHYGDILVGFGATVQSTSPLVPYIDADKIPKSYDILQCGDIIIADTAEDETAGKGIEIINDSIPTISGLHTLPYRPQTKFAPGYLGYFLNSPYYHKQLIPLLHGIKVLSVTKAELEKTIISYPTLPEQQKIASFFTAVDKQIEVEEKRLETMKIIKKGLLQQMFI